MLDSERLSIAQWILERNLQWIAAAEVKIGVIVAIDTGMLGALAAAFNAVPAVQRTVWANLLSALSAGFLVLAIFCAAVSVLPRTDGPPTSFIFFGKIAKRNLADYAHAFRTAGEHQFLDDCLAQIHRNAEIACKKFQWVRSAMMWSFGAVLPWTAALAVLTRAIGK